MINLVNIELRVVYENLMRQFLCTSTNETGESWH